MDGWTVLDKGPDASLIRRVMTRLRLRLGQSPLHSDLAFLWSVSAILTICYNHVFIKMYMLTSYHPGRY